MKKISLLLVGLLALFSCEQEELDNFAKSDVNQVQTRAASSIADFDPISELSEIPVNIINVGNTSNKYLSCVHKGTKIILYPKDEGNGRQRWFLRNGRSIISGGGNNGITSNLYGVLTPNSYLSSDKPDFLLLSYWSKSAFDFPLTGPGFGFNYLPNGNCMINTTYGNFNEGFASYYLQSESSTSTSVKLKTNDSSNLAQWEITPIGEYELVDLEYVRTTVDNFAPTEVTCDHDEYANHSLSVETWNYSFTTTYTETSNFSKTEGTNVSVSQGVSVGLPNVLGEGSTINFNTSIQQQSTRSWTYGTSDTKTITKTRTGQIPVQPGETVKLEAVLIMYKGSVTYVATLRKVGDTKTFRVKGKWSGDCFSTFKARTYSVATGAFLKEYALK